MKNKQENKRKIEEVAATSNKEEQSISENEEMSNTDN